MRYCIYKVSFKEMLVGTNKEFSFKDSKRYRNEFLTDLNLVHTFCSIKKNEYTQY